MMVGGCLWRCHRETIRLRALRYGGQDGGQVEEIKRLLLEYAVMNGDEAEAARLRAELTKLVEKV